MSPAIVYLLPFRHCVRLTMTIHLFQEHAAQSRIVDLETQLTRMKSDIVAVKRSKEDVSGLRCSFHRIETPAAISCPLVTFRFTLK